MTESIKSTEELIREALEKATPGPWTYDPFINGYGVKSGSYINQIALITENSGINRDREQAKNNTHLIANAPTWLKYLLDKVELEKAKSAKWEKAFDNADRQYLKAERQLAETRRLLEQTQRENAAMRETLEKLDAYLDFSEEIADNESIGEYENASGINKAFRKAHSFLSTLSKEASQ